MFHDLGLLQNHCMEHAAAAVSGGDDANDEEGAVTHVVSVDDSTGQQLVTYIAKEDGCGGQQNEQILLQVTNRVLIK